MTMPEQDSIRCEIDPITTPCFIYSPSIVLADYENLRDLLGTPVIVSIKANPNVSLLNTVLPMFRDGVEVATLGELELVVGRTRGPIYFNSPAAGEAEFRAAYAASSIVIIDSVAQLRKALNARSRSNKRVILRIDAAELVGLSVRRMSGYFGMSRSELEQALQLVSSGDADVIGLHAFCGSLSFSLYASQLLENLVEMVSEIRRNHPSVVSITLGVGLPDQSLLGHLDADLKRYRDLLTKKSVNLLVSHEAGRAVFGRSGLYCTRIRTTKVLNDCVVAVVDGAISHHFLLAQTEQRIPRRIAPKVLSSDTVRCKLPNVPSRLLIVGSSCNPKDIIYDGPTFAASVSEGDLLVFENCGAYIESYSPVRFLGAEPIQIYLANGVKWAEPFFDFLGNGNVHRCG
jgi:diaminopimelate decarboxylase